MYFITVTQDISWDLGQKVIALLKYLFFLSHKGLKDRLTVSLSE